VSVGAERVLTALERNRALLERQLLAERRELSLPRALERIGGIQAQYAPSMYIGLWSRLADFERDQLTRALERRTVIQATLMRVTIHLVSKGDYWPMALGVRQASRDGWLAYRRGKATERDVEAAAKLVGERLRGGAAKKAELADGLDTMMFNGAGLWLNLVRVPPAGTWERRRADMYALASEWVGPESGTPQGGLELLIDRYLRGFGPAAPADAANWIGVGPKTVADAIERMDLRHFRDESGKLLVDLPRLPLPAPDAPAPPRFLPTWDATLLVHCRATEILAEADRPKVFSTKTPQSVPTFALDGQVAGKWRYEKGKIEIEPFRKLSRAERAELDGEAQRLAAFHAE
jgi:hypothetical protein